MIKSTINKEDFKILSENIQTLEDYLYSNLLIKKVDKPIPLSLILNPKTLNKETFLGMQEEVRKFDEFLLFCFNNLGKILSYYDEHIDDELANIFIKIIREKNKNNPPKKPISLITRYDFMYDESFKRFMQIEFNNTAVSLGFHNYNVSKILPLIYNNLFHQEKKITANNYPKFHRDIILEAFKTYNNPEAYIAIVNFDDEVNIFESRQIEKLLFENGMRVMMVKMSELKKSNYKTDEEKRFFLKGKEVAICYFRALYNNEDFEDPEKLDFYVHTESSRCINIPDATSVLISLKPIQHLIFSESLLKQYQLKKVKENNFMKFLTPTFILKIDFDNSKGKMIEYIESHGGSQYFILKTFKEGGMGEIIGGENLIDFIKEKDEAYLNHFILVYRIQNPVTSSIVYKNGIVEYLERTISEFGFFGGYVFKQNKEGVYETAFKNDGPWVMRTKSIDNLKGGVAVNASALDCFVLE